MKRAVAERIYAELAAEGATLVEGEIVEPSDHQTDGIANEKADE